MQQKNSWSVSIANQEFFRAVRAQGLLSALLLCCTSRASVLVEAATGLDAQQTGIDHA
ncbi:hypothetical protein BSP239C_03268 [Brevibacterium sp. 239c]|nr:hypothetical protein BSP239C_03268 [Brevibacterium sp. 239c]